MTASLAALRVLALTVLVAPSVSQHYASQAAISLTPDHGPPTSRSVVRGLGFGANEDVAITFDDLLAAVALTDDVGTFSARFRVPRTALPGDHAVTATGQSSGFSATANFLVRTDWPRFHFDNADSGLNPYENVLSRQNVSQLGVRWDYYTGGLIANFRGPAVVEGVVYIGANDGVYALDASSGAFIWVAHAPSGTTTPTVAGDTIFAASTSTVWALDLSTGAVKWSYFTGINSSGYPPVVVKDLVYVGTGTGLIALDVATGTPRWSLLVGFMYPPAVVGNVAYAGSGAGTVYALDARTGSLRWSFPAGGAVQYVSVVGGIAYAPAYNGALYALDAATGGQVWSFTAGGPLGAAAAIAKGVIYVGSDDTNVYALDAADGTLKWTRGLGGSAVGTVVANGVVYAQSSEGSALYALDTRDGAVLRQIGGSFSLVAVTDGVVFTGSLTDVYAMGIG